MHVAEHLIRTGRRPTGARFGFTPRLTRFRNCAMRVRAATGLMIRADVSWCDIPPRIFGAAWLRPWRGSRPSPPPTHSLPPWSFVDADVDPELPTVHAVADWLAEQGIGRVTAVTPQPLLVDIEAADLLVDLDIHPPIEPGLVVSDDAIADCAVRPRNAEWARFDEACNSLRTVRAQSA
jgi:hypothetical protein